MSCSLSARSRPMVNCAGWPAVIRRLDGRMVTTGIAALPLVAAMVTVAVLTGPIRYDARLRQRDARSCAPASPCVVVFVETVSDAVVCPASSVTVGVNAV